MKYYFLGLVLVFAGCGPKLPAAHYQGYSHNSRITQLQAEQQKAYCYTIYGVKFYNAGWECPAQPLVRKALDDYFTRMGAHKSAFALHQLRVIFVDRKVDCGTGQAAACWNPSGAPSTIYMGLWGNYYEWAGRLCHEITHEMLMLRGHNPRVIDGWEEAPDAPELYGGMGPMKKLASSKGKFLNRVAKSVHIKDYMLSGSRWDGAFK